VSAGAISPQSASPGSTLLEVRNVAKSFGTTRVLKSISLQISAGEFLTLLGESGSGKTTLLRLIAGFEQPTSGDIWMANERLDTLPPYKRRVNTVFQSYALFPHLNVRENVAYGLRVRSAPKNEIATRVEEALRMVKMTQFAEARPSTLSGGQQQRIALARALINRPQLLLLDEPLSALDANLRKQMQSELKALQREIGIAFLFVTHDQDEAMALSDRIALLRNGALEQVASPREIYSKPASAYVAQFIGETNLLRGEIHDAVARWGSLQWKTMQRSGSALFSLRPEAIHLAKDVPQTPDGVRFRGTISKQIYGGASEILEIDCGDNRFLRVRIPASGPIAGEHEFMFSTSDAVSVREFAYSDPARNEDPDRN
jgi:spermidine/putrescine transport system ATP-binding protein